MDKEIQDMLNDLPNKKFSKFSDKQLEGFEKIKNFMSSQNSPLKGRKCNENTRKKISNTLQGKSSGSKGKKITEEHKKIISKTQFGKKLSEETKNKLRIINQGKTSGMSVECYSYPEMKFLKNYSNLSIAAKELNLNRECIRLTCVGQRNHTGGYTFKYKK